MLHKSLEFLWISIDGKKYYKTVCFNFENNDIAFFKYGKISFHDD